MKRVHHFRILATVVALCLSVLAISAQAADKQTTRSAAVRDKLVFQVSDDNTGKWSMALSNAKNVQEELGADKVIIEIVVYGPGLGMLTFDSPVGSEVAEAISAGIKFVACENTMKGKHLTKDDMLPSLSYARAAVVELMRKQQQGYAYIKL
jgi:intracellular sulfur oxidation DsrE/DsrF family protein